jgi:adenylate cyclase
MFGRRLSAQSVRAAPSADARGYHGAMAQEIERKFLLSGEAWRREVVRATRMRQGYVAGSERASVRVRIAGNDAWLNIKSGGLTAVRQEFEYAIPAADANELLELAARPLIEKTRHYVEHAGMTFEIDEFEGDNAGLVVAELELEHEGQTFERPGWLGAEVTHLARYYNVNLVKHPYSAWDESERGR